MSTADYPTDSTYISVVVPYLAPTWIDAALRARGAAPPRVAGAETFHYLDLGCGFGTTLMCLAAAYPMARFTGIDANPDHIALAEQVARDAGLTNIAFHTARFGDPVLDSIPVADYVVSHGVFTWIAPVARAALIADIAQLRAPGGALVLGASSAAATARDLPMRRVLASVAAAQTSGTAGDRLSKGLAALKAVGPRGALAQARLDAITIMGDRQKSFADHDLLSEAWAPVWTADLTASLAPHGLDYSGPHFPVHWRQDYTFNKTERAALEAAPSPEARMVLAECMLDTQYANHLFSAPSEGSTDRAAERVALVKPASDVSYSKMLRAGRLNFDNDLTRPIVARLANGPATLSELASCAGASTPDAFYRSIDALYVSHQIAPVDLPQKGERTAELNAALQAAGAPNSASASALGPPIGTFQG